MKPLRAELIALAIVAASIAGCASSSNRNPYAAPSEASRNTLKAQELTQQAAAIMDEDAPKAEALLREALTADLLFGPGHNNLGVVHLKRGQLYEAAHEFEWARKLMPGQPEPRMNLALTLERAGRFDEALATYRTALEVCAGHMPTTQAIARLQLRHGRIDEGTERLLNEIALAGKSQEWREWAREHMIKVDAKRGDGAGTLGDSR